MRWLMVVGAAAVAIAPGGESSPEPLDVVRMVEYVPNQYDWCYYAAAENQFFATHGIELADDPLQVGTDADLNRALLSNEGDISLGTVGLFQSFEEGAEPSVAVIGGSGLAAYSFVGPADREAEGLESLREGTIAIPVDSASGSIATRKLTDALGDGGFTPLVLGGGSAARLAALDAGQAQGAFMAAPYDAVAVAASDALTIIEYVDASEPHYQVGVILARRDWLVDHEDVAVRWMSAYQDGCDWVYDPANREAALAILAERIGIEPSSIEGTYDVYIAGDLAGTTPIRDGAVDQDALLATAILMQQSGLIGETVDVEALITAFVEPDIVESAANG